MCLFFVGVHQQIAQSGRDDLPREPEPVLAPAALLGFIHAESRQPNLIDEMKTRIDSEAGRRIYARRLGIVEPVFANICVQKRTHRFTLRSKRKVDVEWRLFALVHNIGKIHMFGALT
jgi:hypothetical protein